MLDINKHISYWKENAEEDFSVAINLINSNKIRHGLFFLHLALEKILKAHICRVSNNIAPMIHNLIRLAELSGISFTQENKKILMEINPFNIEGRYPEIWTAIPSKQEAEEYLKKTTEVFKWLQKKF